MMKKALYWGMALSLCGFCPAEAYVGPGPGFVLVSTFLIVGLAFLSGIALLFTWPIRLLYRRIRRRRPTQARVKRVVIVGLDGLDARLTEQFAERGLLPNLSRLHYARLQTTLPAASPVAWSTFQTGCNPGKHRIFDFLVPDRRLLRPQLSAARMSPAPHSLKLGKYRLPLGKPSIAVGRRSQPFWHLLGEAGVFSTILRVPLSFPPEPFDGVLLSAMYAPDLRGTQGTFFYYTSDPAERRPLRSGVQLPLAVDGNLVRGTLTGPPNPLLQSGARMQMPFAVHLDADGAELRLGRQRYALRRGEYTPWVRVAFRPVRGRKVRGLCRFLLLESSPHVKLYATPLQLDPAHPALPISHPLTYSIYLGKALGPFATLGLAEDTSALNEGVIDAEAFLQQCRLIHAERETMLFDALDKTPRGLVVCVFDITDRVQHMFWSAAAQKDHPQRDVVRQLYEQMDDLVGRVQRRLDPDTVLLVMSDHGFTAFRRGVDLNAWLRQNGYLHLHQEAESQDMLQALDWSRTRAYAMGFGGIYLNLAGREARGIVAPGEEADALKGEIAAGLRQLCDGDNPAIAQVYDRDQVYRGPYAPEAPDLVVGFKAGYRVAWETVTGGLGTDIFADNTRAWAGDHSVDPPEVPGVLFANRPGAGPEPHIADIAPTVLDLFGVPVPDYVDGKSLELDPEASALALESETYVGKES